MRTENEVEANGRIYNPASNCAVVICLDGCEPEYLDIAISEGLMPNLKRIRAGGTDALAHSVIPSFTNPNNVSIVTGVPPSIHGICGNYFFDPLTQEEVMMNDIKFLRDFKDINYHANKDLWQPPCQKIPFTLMDPISDYKKSEKYFLDPLFARYEKTYTDIFFCIYYMSELSCLRD